MFDHRETGIGLSELGVPSGESLEERQDDQFAYELTCRALADGWTTPDQVDLPAGFDSMKPGPFLAAIVASTDVHRLNGFDVIRLVQARQRLASHHEAGKHEAIAEVAYIPPGDRNSGVLRSSEQYEYAAVEVAAALTLTRRASEDQLSRAVAITERLRRVLDVFYEGRLDLPKVRVFEQALGHLPDETVEWILDEVLDDAEDLTTGQLRARLAKLVMIADPDGEKSSYEAGLADRKVVTGGNPDHTANFGIYSGPPDAVAAARAYVEERARSLKTEDEPRTLDQLRTDVALDLLRGKCDHPDHAGTGGGRANITISAETLARLSDEPAELDGFGPVIAEIGRKTVRENINGEWVFTVTDQGRPVATGTLSRRPTAGQCRQVASQYPTCVMVGCREPAYQCDLDHRRPHSEGGPTHNDNLGPLCRHHHMVRHHTPWRLERRENGDHVWVSPLGHTYIRKRDPPD